MPSVQKAHELLQDSDVVLVMISIDGLGGRAVEPLMTAQGYTFPALLDQRMEVARLYGMRLVPTTYVLNREGRIVGAGYGPIDFAAPEFVQFLESLRTPS